MTMSFSVIFVSLLLIGSSAANHYYWLQSLQYLQSRTNTYIVWIATINGGFQQFKTNGLYTAFTAMELLETWSTAARNAINGAIAPRVTFSESIKNRITEATIKTMGLINRDPQIFIEHKGSRCPIFTLFGTIMAANGGEQSRTQFQQNFANIPQ